MNRLAFSIMVALGAAIGIAAAGTPAYVVNLDTQFPDRQWEIKYAYVRATPLVRANLLTNGVGWTASSDWSGFLWYGTNSNWASTNGGGRLAGTFYTNQTYADFQFTTNTFTNAGIWYCGIVSTNATNWIEWGLGKIWVRVSGGVSP
jgi:hypothetical protein